MLSLAANLGLLVATYAGQDGLLQLQQSQWSQLQPSVVTLLRSGRPAGVAVLIHPKGLFLASGSSVQGSTVSGKDHQGRMLTFRVLKIDDPTQLSLLEAQVWQPSKRLPVVISQYATPSAQLFAATPSGLFRVELAAGDSFGLISRSESRRVLPLSEIRFEFPSQSIGGAAIFNSAGELVGMLDATLRADEKVPLAAQGEFRLKPSVAADPAVSLQTKQSSRFGPSALTVGYSVAPPVLDRVVRGFLSKDQEVRHPVIGVFCRDAEKDGALVESVVANSPAALAGIQPGDVILELGGKKVRNQIAFSGTMMMQRAGSQIALRIRRGGEVRNVTVLVGP